MDCTRCIAKSCRKGTSCISTKVSQPEMLVEYHKPYIQHIVKSAALLVDNGRAGELSRLEEIIEFAKSMRFYKIGLAYCYGMEIQAADIADHVRKSGLELFSVSCTVGALTQEAVNTDSSICNVSCNPIGQAKQLNREEVDLTIAMGLCLGHDILFNKYIETPVTTLVVKDRVYAHDSLEILNETKLTV